MDRLAMGMLNLEMQLADAPWDAIEDCFAANEHALGIVGGDLARCSRES